MQNMKKNFRKIFDPVQEKAGRSVIVLHAPCKGLRIMPQTKMKLSHRLRILRMIGEREKRGLPAPNRDWFSEGMLPTVDRLVDDGFLQFGCGVSLTDPGRHFLACGPTKRSRQKSDIRAHKQANR